MVSDITRLYSERTPTSAKLAERAAGLFPSGVTHDLRHQDPYPIYVERALGPRKWDVDGNEYIDYIGGHGALLLGHGHPDIVAALRTQAERATHPGAAHELEVRWGELVKFLVPSAERLRFTASGTEATLLALRLARAYTAKSKIIQFKGHFHGWQDHVVAGFESPDGNSPPPGVLAGIVDASIALAPGDREQVSDILDRDPDIAAIIIEPTGAHFGSTPLQPDFLKFLREVATAQHCLLIFDEVVTGFRVAPGGMQQVVDVLPDLTTLGKILTGGVPGGAVAGRADILDQIDFRVSREQGRSKVNHPGTFNANPLSASAGIAALEIIRETETCEQANGLGEYLRTSLNGVLAGLKLNWAIYGTYSGFHLFTNSAARTLQPDQFDENQIPIDELTTHDKAMMSKLRLAMLVNGVDISPRFSGFLSASHTTADIDLTATAFQRALEMIDVEENH